MYLLESWNLAEIMVIIVKLYIRLHMYLHCTGI